MRRFVRSRVLRRFVVVLFVSGSLVWVVSATGTASRASAASAPRVDVVSLGKAPRSTLRMAVSEGTEVGATMQMSVSIHQSMAGRKINAVALPAVTVRMHERAGVPAPNGNTPISFGYSDVGVVDDGSLTEAQLAQYQVALEPLGSITGTGTLTPRNRFLDSKVAGTENLDPAIARTMSQLADQLGTLSTPFPREPVGIGARWRVSSRLRLNGIDVQQTTQITLRDRNEDRVVLDIKLIQTAPHQRVDMPGMPKGTRVEITRFKTSGSGSTALSLSRPILPLEAEMHASGKQLLDVTAQGDRGTFVQTATVDVKVSQ